MASEAYSFTQGMKRRKGERTAIILKAAVESAMSTIDSGADKNPLDIIQAVYRELFEALAEAKLVESER
jgi:hypothetical protein